MEKGQCPTVANWEGGNVRSRKATPTTVTTPGQVFLVAIQFESSKSMSFLSSVLFRFIPYFLEINFYRSLFLIFFTFFRYPLNEFAFVDL